MRRLIVLVIALAPALATPLLAQRRGLQPARPEHWISAEVIIVSSANVSYEYQPIDELSLRIGLTSIPPYGDDNAKMGVPLMATWVSDGANVRFLLGAGAIVPLGEGAVLPTGTLGVRFQPTSRGIFGTLAWRPIVIPMDQEGNIGGILVQILSLAGAGASIGYCF